FPTEDSNTYFISPSNGRPYNKKEPKESSLKDTGISDKSFENLDYIQNKFYFKSGTNKSVTSMTLNEGDHLSEEQYFEKQQLAEI
ncbi:hypothetical protein Avbf_16857, partial [Armadillidium vulgare]